MAEQDVLERANIQDLELATSILTPTWNVVRVIGRDTPTLSALYGDDARTTIYDDDSDLLEVSRQLSGKIAGSLDEDKTASDLRRTLEGMSNGATKQAGIDEKLREVIAAHEEIIWSNTLKRAKTLGSIIAGKEAYVAAMADDECVYVASVVGVLALRDENKFGIEPIVDTEIGERLLPPGLYMYRGLFARTV